MRSSLLRFLLLLAVLWLERVLWPQGAALGVQPDFVLILLVGWLSTFSRGQAVAWGFLAGLMQDLAAPGVTGVMALSKAVGAFAACSLPSGRSAHPLIGAALGILVLGSIQTGFALLFYRSFWAEGMFNAALRYGLPRLLTTLVAGLLLQGVAGWIERWRGGR